MQDTDHIERDRKLVHAARANVDAFANIVDCYEAPLLRYILRISSLSHAEAEEVLQETFLSCWKNLRGYDQSLPFRSWLYRIAHNQTISTFRKKKTRNEEKQEELDLELFDLADGAEELGVRLDRKERGKQVYDVLQNLKADHREVLVLRYLEGYDYEAISDILRKPPGTVATLLRRAKKAFQQSWKRLHPTPTL